MPKQKKVRPSRDRLSDAWNSVRTAVKRMLSEDLKEDFITGKGHKFDEKLLKEDVKILCMVDPPQLFRRLESIAHEHIMKIKVDLWPKLLEAHTKQQNPDQAGDRNGLVESYKIFIKQFLERFTGYEQTMRHMCPILEPLDTFLDSFGISWKLISHNLFDNVIYQDAMFKVALRGIESIFRCTLVVDDDNLIEEEDNKLHDCPDVPQQVVEIVRSFRLLHKLMATTRQIIRQTDFNFKAQALKHLISNKAYEADVHSMLTDMKGGCYEEFNATFGVEMDDAAEAAAFIDEIGDSDRNKAMIKVLIQQGLRLNSDQTDRPCSQCSKKTSACTCTSNKQKSNEKRGIDHYMMQAIYSAFGTNLFSSHKYETDTEHLHNAYGNWEFQESLDEDDNSDTEELDESSFSDGEDSDPDICVETHDQDGEIFIRLIDRKNPHKELTDQQQRIGLKRFYRKEINVRYLPKKCSDFTQMVMAYQPFTIPAKDKMKEAALREIYLELQQKQNGFRHLKDTFPEKKKPKLDLENLIPMPDYVFRSAFSVIPCCLAHHIETYRSYHHMIRGMAKRKLMISETESVTFCADDVRKYNSSMADKFLIPLIEAENHRLGMVNEYIRTCPLSYPSSKMYTKASSQQMDPERESYELRVMKAAAEIFNDKGTLLPGRYIHLQDCRGVKYDTDNESTTAKISASDILLYQSLSEDQKMNIFASLEPAIAFYLYVQFYSALKAHYETLFDKCQPHPANIKLSATVTLPLNRFRELFMEGVKQDAIACALFFSKMLSLSGDGALAHFIKFQAVLHETMNDVYEVHEKVTERSTDHLQSVFERMEEQADHYDTTVLSPHSHIDFCCDTPLAKDALFYLTDVVAPDSLEHMENIALDVRINGLLLTDVFQIEIIPSNVFLNPNKQGHSCKDHDHHHHYHNHPLADHERRCQKHRERLKQKYREKREEKRREESSLTDSKLEEPTDPEYLDRLAAEIECIGEEKKNKANKQKQKKKQKQAAKAERRQKLDEERRLKEEEEKRLLEEKEAEKRKRREEEQAKRLAAKAEEMKKAEETRLAKLTAAAEKKKVLLEKKKKISTGKKDEEVLVPKEGASEPIAIVSAVAKPAKVTVPKALKNSQVSKKKDYRLLTDAEQKSEEKVTAAQAAFEPASPPNDWESLLSSSHPSEPQPLRVVEQPKPVKKTETVKPQIAKVSAAQPRPTSTITILRRPQPEENREKEEKPSPPPPAKAPEVQPPVKERSAPKPIPTEARRLTSPPMRVLVRSREEEAALAQQAAARAAAASAVAARTATVAPNQNGDAYPPGLVDPAIKAVGGVIRPPTKYVGDAGRPEIAPLHELDGDLFNNRMQESSTPSQLNNPMQEFRMPYQNLQQHERAASSPYESLYSYLPTESYHNRDAMSASPLPAIGSERKQRTKEIAIEKQMLKNDGIFMTVFAESCYAENFQNCDILLDRPSQDFVLSLVRDLLPPQADLQFLSQLFQIAVVNRASKAPTLRSEVKQEIYTRVIEFALRTQRTTEPEVIRTTTSACDLVLGLINRIQSDINVKHYCLKISIKCAHERVRGGWTSTPSMPSYTRPAMPVPPGFMVGRRPHEAEETYDAHPFGEMGAMDNNHDMLSMQLMNRLSQTSAIFADQPQPAAPASVWPNFALLNVRDSDHHLSSFSAPLSTQQHLFPTNGQREESSYGTTTSQESETRLVDLLRHFPTIDQSQYQHDFPLTL